MKHLIYTFIFLFICSFSFSQDLQPDNKRALLHVVVTDFKNAPKKGETVIFKAEKSGKTVKKVTGADGKFDILLPKGETYKIAYQDFLEEKNYSSIDVEAGDGIMEATLTIQMENQLNAVYELDIHFKTNEAIIQDESYALLDEMANIMRVQDELKIEVSGHTDSDGSDESNMVLSKKRADSVKAYLVKTGIDAGRVVTKGFGESKPIADNGTDSGKARNRRTEIRIIE